MGIIRAIFLLSFLFIESHQQQIAPSVVCAQDNSAIMGMFFPGSYSSSINRGGRIKCTFSNINAFDQMTRVLNEKAVNGINVISIAFNQSNLSSFPDKAFSTYANLRSLDGSSLRLTNISSNVFSGMKSLESVVLSFNNLTALPSKALANLKLKSLDLSSNLISTIDETAFVGSEIDRIDLSFNKIKSTKFISSFKSFNYMQINDNEIETLEKIEISKSNDVGVNVGISLPSQLFLLLPNQNPSINLQNNKIKKFECSSSVPLMLIDLTNNRDLSDVKLNDCKIERLDVSECVNLKSLKMTDNLSGLTAKNVKFDQIEFSEKTSLSSLILVNNSLGSNVIESISKLENLTYLELSYNQIGPLNVSTFAKLKKLQTLKLKATNISNISFGTFSHQGNIKDLDISDNNLGVFDMHMIYTMNGLISLDVSGNGLSELANLDTAHLTFSILERIDLSNNKWSCMYLMRLIKIMKTYRVVLVQSTIEEHQSNINGIFCMHVEGEDSIVPLTPENSNLTEIREKMNEIIFSNQRQIERVAMMEKRLDSQANAEAALRFSPPSSEKVISGEMQVKNSSLLEFVLIVVCGCFTVYMAMQIFIIIKRNFISKARSMRGVSEHNLTMNVNDY